ncbi:hypothetical protein F4X10_02720 [Candidatus Poribacteria bacterium]|nr:hypothetical protein [Candidatus Poribacteria bacterium]
MLNYFRRTAQVVMLTFLLVFGTLLMVGSFEMPGWSDSHHGYEKTRMGHETVFLLFYVGKETTIKYYHNSGHSDTNHT